MNVVTELAYNEGAEPPSPKNYSIYIWLKLFYVFILNVESP